MVARDRKGEGPAELPMFLECQSRTGRGMVDVLAFASDVALEGFLVLPEVVPEPCETCPFGSCKRGRKRRSHLSHLSKVNFKQLPYLPRTARPTVCKESLHVSSPGLLLLPEGSFARAGRKRPSCRYLHTSYVSGALNASCAGLTPWLSGATLPRAPVRLVEAPFGLDGPSRR